MASAALRIKLRCASWQQLTTIYRRDLSRGTMFLKSASQPSLGTIVRIDLELPSATVIELVGTIAKHVTDHRGSGVELQLEPLPTKSVWVIESALAAETKVRAASSSEADAPAPAATTTGPVSTLTEGEDIAAAEVELVRALEAEVESLRKLNPFLVLGVGYEAADADVRAAFGELTKRYHPDRFARYQSPKLRQVAAEIFILIRDAYRKLADADSRAQAVAALGPKAVTSRLAAPVRAPSPVPSRQTPTQGIPAIPKSIAVPPVPAPPRPPAAPTTPLATDPHDAPTHPSPKSSQLANTELARPDMLAVPVAQPESKSGPARTRDVRSDQIKPIRDAKSGPIRVPIPAVAPSDSAELSPLEAMIDEGRLDEALAGYRMLAKKHPNELGYRAGMELCEGLRALAQRDRLEAAQRFEAALELDPSNERAARELADMRRQATNERKGLLSRLMGKKEPT